MIKQVSILNVNFINATKRQFLKTLDTHLDSEEKKFIVTANPEIVMYSHRNAEFRGILSQASYVTPDGVGIKVASNLLDCSIQERITGFDTMVDLLRVAEAKGKTVYFLGAKEHILQKALIKIKNKYPLLKIVGSHNGYFDPNESIKIVDEIKRSAPDLVFVALGAPKQEKWIANNYSSFSKGIFMGVGGSLDILSGEIKRAPYFWRRLNLEWMYRLVVQPWRWKRMLEIPRFLLLILKEKGKKQMQNREQTKNL